MDFLLKNVAVIKQNISEDFFYARTEPNEPRKNVLAMPLSGLLVDCFGISTITGEISSIDLKFCKKYHGTGNLIEYCFKINKNGIWIGKYSADKQIGTGYAEAKINLDWQDVDMIVPKPFDPENLAKSLLEKMVDRGVLVPTNAEETGEELFIPR